MGKEPRTLEKGVPPSGSKKRTAVPHKVEETMLLMQKLSLCAGFVTPVRRLS